MKNTETIMNSSFGYLALKPWEFITIHSPKKAAKGTAKMADFGLSCVGDLRSMPKYVDLIRIARAGTGVTN